VTLRSLTCPWLKCLLLASLVQEVS
jgi:hypothetical protein